MSFAAIQQLQHEQGATPVKDKRSLKEIQEEEESRKKFAAKEVAVAQAAAKRGYAESTSKVCAIALLSKFLC